ncbi:MAG TPA: ABC transporter ATP-binding protein [Chloroflexota bacterium]|nr:ABC transporter ATP-binding protein [Chloroflexota bacterium]
MIEVQNLSKAYADKTAVRDITFSVNPGEILGFLGPNGAGKTTTMRILTGYMPATSGKAKVAGYDVFTQSLEVRKRIGYLPEIVPLYPEMPVESYLKFVARLKGLPGNRLQERLEYALEVTHIADVRSKVVSKLSKGYKQRVGIAQALIHDPDVLILDEPTVGLDPKQINETRQLIKSLGGRHTIVLSTHILPEVSMTCQRVVIINNGQVAAEDTPENLTRRLQGRDRVQLEVRAPKQELVATLRAVPGVTHVSAQEVDGHIRCEVEGAGKRDVRADLATAVVGKGWGLLELKTASMSLEDIFLQLTTREEAAA